MGCADSNPIAPQQATPQIKPSNQQVNEMPKFSQPAVEEKSGINTPSDMLALAKKNNWEPIV